MGQSYTPWKSPRHPYIYDHDVLIDNFFILFEPKIKKITLFENASLQCVYSAARIMWKSNPELMKYPFPFIAIHAEMFETCDGWEFTEVSLPKIRIAGLKTTENGKDKFYAGIEMLSCKGCIFDEKMSVHNNGQLLEFDQDGFKGYYQKSFDHPLLSATDVVKEFIGEHSSINHIYYRIL